MQLDVVDLRDFYNRPLGGVVRRLLTQPHPRALAQRAGQPADGARLRRALHRHVPRRGLAARRADAGGPGRAGVAGRPARCTPSWSRRRCCRWPMPPSTGCSACIAWRPPSAPAPLLREMWRVLTPEGRLLLIVPNRRGVWARLDTTPFGHGRPYSRGQLERLLTDALFTPLEWTTRALHAADRPALAGALGHRVRARRARGCGRALPASSSSRRARS